MMKLSFVHLTATVLAMLVIDNAAAQTTTETEAVQEPVTATTPVPRDDAWWIDRHADKLAEKADALANGKEIKLVFVGDSITHHWETTGKALWDKRYPQYGALNLGYSGDRTEHVLWRLGLGDAGEENNEIAGLAPKLFVVMIGTNNTGHRQDPAEETAAGIEAIVDRLHELSPDSRVLLLAIFPRGAKADDPLRKLNDAINEQIESLGEREYVTFTDISNSFLVGDRELPASVMPDFLHPNEEGYRRWRRALDMLVGRMIAGY